MLSLLPLQFLSNILTNLTHYSQFSLVVKPPSCNVHQATLFSKVTCVSHGCASEQLVCGVSEMC